MVRGIVIGLAIGLLLIAIGIGYEWKTGRRIVGPTVQEKIASLDEATLNSVRNNPETIFVQAKDENLPAFLAFRDLDTSVTDASVKEYATLMNEVSKRYNGATRKEIVGSVLELATMKQYYLDLTHRECLQYLLDAAPVNADGTPVEGVPNLRQSTYDVQTMLLTEYLRPEMEARQQQQAQQAQAQAYQSQLQATIRDNAAKAKERGAMRTAAKANELQNNWLNQQTNMYWEDYQYRRSDDMNYNY